jgi:ribosome biogenesis GTPase / thiamine phosphate phosphatase
MFVSQLPGYGPFFSDSFRLLARPDLIPARIVGVDRASFQLAGSRAERAELSGRLRHELAPHERPTVGDWVAVTDDAQRAIIQAVLPRRTALYRRAAGLTGDAQAIAANVDVVLIVTSANRDANPRRVERYLAVVRDSGAAPVVVVNKIDLGGDVSGMVAELEAVCAGAPLVAVSAATGDGVEALRAMVGVDCTVGLIGMSGVGKSSLVNRLLGREIQAVAGIDDDDRGRHTTTRRELLELPGGGLLIDTPGMRELGLVDDGGGVEASFDDVSALAAACRFADCSHGREPGCAVQAAIDGGDLDPDRLASYRKLLRELAAAERRGNPLAQARERQRWKVIHAARRARGKVEPKHRR